MIGIFVPTLSRPRALQRVANNVTATSTYPCTLAFIVEKDDDDSYTEAIRVATDNREKIKPRIRVLVNKFYPSYSNAIQTAYTELDNPYFVCANDDFEFTFGWDVEAMKVMDETGAGVVGIDDGAPTCIYSTIALIRRSYIEEKSGVIDMPGRVLYPYKHNYVDTELYQTALCRGDFHAAPKALIKHIHPDWGHVPMDSTYMKTRASLSEDGHKFNERAHLWQSLSQP